jgi:ribosomal protein S18 acetylase RimI-like enzyme
MKKMLFFLLITASLSANLQIVAHTLSKSEKNMENDHLRTSLEWVSYLNEISPPNTSGQFICEDLFGKPVILEWTKTDIRSPDLAAFKKNICELACQVIAPIEVQFLRSYPQAVSQELFLKPCAPLFENGLEAVDWEIVRETIQSTIRQFYLTDLSSFGDALIKPLLNDIYYLATIKDQGNEEIAGFIMCAVTPALPFGNVKVINLAVAPEEKKRGLDRLLMSSVFTIIPKVNRLFLFVRPTNESVIQTYRSWGFTQDLDPIQDPNHKINTEYLIPLEFRVEQSNQLQEPIKTLNKA